MISVKPIGANIPEKKYLQNGYKKNKDGLGIAIWKKNSLVHIKKDFNTFEDFYRYLQKNVNQEDIALIHFRLATHGLKDKGNRHPFPITRNKNRLRILDLKCKQAIVHNGVITGYSHKKYSDTQKFILDILSDAKIKNNLTNRVIQKMISSYIGSDRLAIVDTDGTLIMIGEFVEQDGCFYSNDNYKDKVKVISSSFRSIKGVHCYACFTKKKKKKVRYRKEYDEFLCKKCYKEWKKEKVDEYTDTDYSAIDRIERLYAYERGARYECPKCKAPLNEQDIFTTQYCPLCYADLSKYSLRQIRVYL